MNLIDKLITNYRECADIVNPFYFTMESQRRRTPIYTMGDLTPTYMTNNRHMVIELSANPDNINIHPSILLEQKELTIFNRGQMIELKHITSMDLSKNLSTGCIELKIKCATATILGGNENE